jgi:hypothetical protein
MGVFVVGREHLGWHAERRQLDKGRSTVCADILRAFPTARMRNFDRNTDSWLQTSTDFPSEPERFGSSPRQSL